MRSKFLPPAGLLAVSAVALAQSSQPIRITVDATDASRAGHLAYSYPAMRMARNLWGRPRVSTTMRTCIVVSRKERK